MIDAGRLVGTVQPERVLPLQGEPAGRHRRIGRLAGSPAVPGPGRAAAVDLMQISGEQVGVESVPDGVEVDSRFDGGSLHQRRRGNCVPQLADRFAIPPAQQQIGGTRR